jgi:uncharacterized protein (DUF736 family)
MANNGKLAPHEQGFRGTIVTLAVKFDVTLERNPLHKPTDPNSPKFDVLARANHGDMVKIGAAWEKTIERGDHVGEKFLSITVDDVSMDKPLNVTAFMREGGNYEVTWSRPRTDAREFKPDPGRAVA